MNPGHAALEPLPAEMPGPLPPPWDGPLDLSSDEFVKRTQPVLAAQPRLALAIGQRALAQAVAEGDVAGRIRALLLLGSACDVLGLPERDERLSEALTHAEALGEPALLVYAVSARMVADIYRGRYAEALARGQSVLGLAHVLRRDDLLGRLLNNLGTALSLIGEYRMAIEMYEERLRRLPEDAQQQRVRTCNNIAVAWHGLARRLRDEQSAAPEVAAALATARGLAEAATESLMHDPNVSLRLSALDTLVGVLLEQDEADAAMHWVRRTGAASAGAVQAGTAQWGMLTLARARVELALPHADAAQVVLRLREVEALPGPKFRSGEMHMLLMKALSVALQRTGDHAGALRCHDAWWRAEARAHSVVARERATAVQNTFASLRGETEEFITHDLRNPLSAALLQLSGAELDGLTPARRENLVRARAAVERALQTAESYLAIMRTRTLRRDDLQPLDLSALADDIGEQIAPPAGAAVRLERDIDWGLTVLGDRISLMKALTQLLRNAMRHAPAGTPVRMTLARRGRQALLTVVDQGAGMAPSMQTRLLRRVPMDDRRHGRGMGLTMIARVARLHDARITVRAPRGEGSTVSLAFELCAESA
jgi:signal transduction histidine kinase